MVARIDKLTPSIEFTVMSQVPEQQHSLSPAQATEAKAALSSLDKLAATLETMTPEERSEALQKLIQESVATDHKPKSWKPRTVASYYTRKHAEEVKTWLDKLLANKGNDLLIERRRHMLSTNSLYLKINQGWLWLRENHMPVEEREQYIKLRQFVDVHKRPGLIRLAWKAPVERFDEIDGEVEVVNPGFSTRDWKEEFDTYCENAVENEKFERKIDFASDDLEYIRSSLTGADGFHVIKCQKDWVLVLFRKEGVPV